MNHIDFKIALESLGISQADFAELMGVSQKTVSFWVGNKSPVPKAISEYIKVRLMAASIAKQLLNFAT